MVYIISYDLQAPTQRYDALTARIKAYPNWACLGGSVYMIETNESHVQVRDNLGQEIDGNDKLFVAKVSAPAAWKGYSQEVTDWIKAKLQ